MRRAAPAASPDAYVHALSGWQRRCVETLRAAIAARIRRWGPVSLTDKAIDLDLDEDAIAEALSGHELLTFEEGMVVDPVIAAREIVKLAHERLEKSGTAIAETFGEPDLFTGDGNRWFRVDTLDKAKLATHLGETAIAHYWEGTRKNVPGEDSHEWLIMLDQNDRAVVTLAAKKEGRESCYPGMLADCHVTGYRNTPAFQAHEEDIRMACAELGLACEPNHMGGSVPEPEDDGPGL